jgi:hypothetical protein
MRFRVTGNERPPVGCGGARKPHAAIIPEAPLADQGKMRPPVPGSAGEYRAQGIEAEHIAPEEIA